MGYRLPRLFPNEHFVTYEVAQHFQRNGYNVSSKAGHSGGHTLNVAPNTHRDLDICAVKGYRQWRIECVGNMSNPSYDFEAGLGQLAKSIDTLDANYAIALPRVKKYTDQFNQLPDLYKEQLKLHVIWVEDRPVRVTVLDHQGNTAAI